MRNCRKAILGKLALSTIFGVSTVILTGNVAFADRWTAQVRAQLIVAAEAAGYNGYSLTHEPLIDDLGNGGQHDITLNLSAGTRYIMVGACDEYCEDLDLGLYDHNGNLISSDTKTNDIPIIVAIPRWNAQFVLRVRMASCLIAPCRYGIGVFGN